jgi:membrane protein implicated in regulation of membrane protease activity
MADQFDSAERRRAAAQRLKAAMVTDASGPRRVHWRDRWTYLWLQVGVVLLVVPLVLFFDFVVFGAAVTAGSVIADVGSGVVTAVALQFLIYVTVVYMLSGTPAGRRRATADREHERIAAAKRDAARAERKLR